MTEILARLEPSLGRRWFGVISLTVIGLVLLYVALARPPEGIAARILLLLFALLLLWQAQWNLRVTKTGLYLTEAGLFDGDDNLICAVSNMLEVDRGLFAFRPANGFLVRLAEPEKKGWAPGLYWRFGRRLGVGGATQASQAKNMADMIAVMIQERSMGPDPL
jgi:hypothetical protein